MTRTAVLIGMQIKIHMWTPVQLGRTGIAVLMYG
jgi:hypothetical protein